MDKYVERIEITIRCNGKDTVHELLFNKDDDELSLTEEDMYEIGFCGDIFLDNGDGSETALSLVTGNPEFYHGDKVIDGIAVNLYPLCEYEKTVDFAEVIDIKPFFYPD